MVRSLVRFALAQDLHKQPITRVAISQKVMGDYGKERITNQVNKKKRFCKFLVFFFVSKTQKKKKKQTNKVIKKAQKVIKATFGYDLVELQKEERKESFRFVFRFCCVV